MVVERDSKDTGAPARKRPASAQAPAAGEAEDVAAGNEALAPILQPRRAVNPASPKKRTAEGGSPTRSLVTLVVGVVIGGGIAAIGFDWRSSPPAAGQSWAADSAQHAPHTGAEVAPANDSASLTVDGTVLEVVEASRYTYLRLDLGSGRESWAAVTKAPVTVGAKVRIGNAMVMTDFNSPSLKRTFPQIYFGELQDGSAPAAGNDPHGAGTAAPSPRRPWKWAK